MNRKVILLLVLIVTKLFATKKIEVYLNFNECVNCYAILNILHTLPDYEKTIVIAKTDSLMALEFLENYNLPSDISYRYISKKNSPLSYCKVYNNDALADSFALKNISSKMASITQLKSSKKELRSFNIPSTMAFNFERLDVSVKGNYFNIYDYSLNKNVIFTLDPFKDTISRVIEIKGKAFSPRLFFKLGRLDSSLYYICYDFLKQNRWADAQIESSLLTDSSIILLLNFPSLHVNPKNIADTIVGMSFYLYEKGLVSNAKKLFALADQEMTKQSNNRFFIDNSRPLFMRSGKLFISVNDTKKSEDKFPLFASFTHNKNQWFEFEKMDSLTFEKNLYLSNNINKHFIQLNRQFYFDVSLKLLVDYHKSKALYLKNLDLSATNYYARDVVQAGDTLKIIVSKEEIIELLEYDLKTEKVIKRIKLEISDCSPRTLRFYDPKTLAFINKLNTKIHLQDIEK